MPCASNWLNEMRNIKTQVEMMQSRRVRRFILCIYFGLGKRMSICPTNIHIKSIGNLRRLSLFYFISFLLLRVLIFIVYISYIFRYIIDLLIIVILGLLYISMKFIIANSIRI